MLQQVAELEDQVRQMESAHHHLLLLLVLVLLLLLLTVPLFVRLQVQAHEPFPSWRPAPTGKGPQRALTTAFKHPPPAAANQPNPNTRPSFAGNKVPRPGTPRCVCPMLGTPMGLSVLTKYPRPSCQKLPLALPPEQSALRLGPPPPPPKADNPPDPTMKPRRPPPRQRAKGQRSARRRAMTGGVNGKQEELRGPEVAAAAAAAAVPAGRTFHYSRLGPFVPVSTANPIRLPDIAPRRKR